jgi:PKD domain-containing protein
MTHLDSTRRASSFIVVAPGATLGGMARPRGSKCIAGAIVAFIVVACSSSSSDGAPCEEDGECASGRCLDGFCTGSDCDDDGDCEDGWRCINSPVLIFDDHLCKATCGHCPPNQQCAPGAVEGTDLCSQKPTVAPTISVDPTALSGVVGQALTMKATASSPNGEIRGIEWDFGDGAPKESGETVTHAYARAGTFNANAKATDARKHEATAQIKVAICDRDCGVGVCQDATGNGKTTCEPGVMAPDVDRAVLGKGEILWIRNRTLKACATTGCPAGPRIVADKTPSDRSNLIATDGESVFFLDDSETLVRCPTAGCGSGPVSMGAKLDIPQALTADATTVYFASYDSGQKIHACPKAGCGAAPKILADHICETSGTGVCAKALVSDGTRVYWNDDDGIYACAASGCNNKPVKIAPFAATTNALALHGAHVYWSTHDGSLRGVFRCPKEGCGSAQPEKVSEQVAHDIAFADDETLYLHTEGTGTSPAGITRGRPGMPEEMLWTKSSFGSRGSGMFVPNDTVIFVSDVKLLRLPR